MKKLILFIILAVYTTLGFSQDYKIIPGMVLKTAEQEFVILVNDYRKEKGLEPVVLDNKYYSNVYNQSYYLSHLNEYFMRTGNNTLYISHGQELDLPDYTEITREYKGTINRGECVTHKMDWLFEFNKRTEKEIATMALNCWKKSPPHNATLLNKEYKKISICCYRTQIIDYTPIGQKFTYKAVIFASTLVMGEW